MIYASRFLRLEDPPMQGPDVREVQEILKRLGFYAGVADGIFGKITQSAVVKFQQSISMAADGVVGPHTWNQLTLRNTSKPMGAQITDYGLPSIYIDTVKRKLRFSSDSLNKTYKCAVGKPTTPSPLGNWTIVQKTVDPGGPFGVRWMRLSVPWGGYGIHGTNNPKSIGKAVSHGCIRMYNQEVVEIYDLTPIGTPVTIVGKAYANRNVKKGDSGTDVAEVQKMLKYLKYLRGKTTGKFGPLTEQAVKSFQTDKALLVDGIVGPQTIFELQMAYALAKNHQQP